MKATAKAPANIAFIKYWGKKDEVLRLPENGSLSMNLSHLWSKTTVEFSAKYKEDEIFINAEKEAGEESRVVKHLGRVRELAKLTYRAKVVSQNNFPLGTGLASSASGFSALTLAAAASAGLKLSEKELSILARQGSGSACRSIPDGFVEWLDGETSDSSYSLSLYPPNYWQISDVVALVSQTRKKISSTQGQRQAKTSPFKAARISAITEKIKTLKKALKMRNFPLFGQIVESEALELHAICLTSQPPLIYWEPPTLAIIKAVQQWREKGLESYFTIDAGPAVHLICQTQDEQAIVKKLKKIKGMSKIVVNRPAVGARIIDKHLF